VTLVELIVVMAIGVVVIGVLLRTFDETQRQARRGVTRNTLRQEALLALHRVSAIVSEAVPLSSLDASAEAAEIFEPTRLQVASWRGATDEDCPVYLIRQDDSPETQSGAPRAGGQSGPTVSIARLNFDGSPASSEPWRSNVNATLRFQYAAAPNASGELAWSDSAPAGAFPALVRVAVTTQDRASRESRFTVETVCATGREATP
jgi:type II secretory pathway pseudopilin PulG